MSAYNLKAANNQAMLNTLDTVSFIHVLLAVVFLYIFRRTLLKQLSYFNPFPLFHDNNFSILL